MQSTNDRQYSEQELVRREKLAALQKNGNDPFASTAFDQTRHSLEIKQNFATLEGQSVSVAGRLMTCRKMGKASFITIQDRDGALQCYLSVNDLGEPAYETFKTAYDIGDLIGVKGKVFKTKTEEISVHAESLTLLAKALEPLPEKYHGIQDPEIKYRRRYLDLIMDRNAFDAFRTRSKIISFIRRFLDNAGFLEVETPVLSPIASGAAARPFTTSSNRLKCTLHLRIATELYLKRCIVGGMERVYEIGKNFRNEGVDALHYPEFTLIELYQTYTDYKGMMELCENLVAQCALETIGSTTVNYQDTPLHFAPPWRRLSMIDSIKEYGGVDFHALKTDEQARKIAEDHGFAHKLKKKLANCTRGDILEAAFDHFVEKNLIQPTFITDYPTDISPLTKQKPDDPALTERFEAFVFGRELANAYSELNDPIVQLDRFHKQYEDRLLGNEEIYELDEDFIASLEVGMPPTGGMGIGIDRLVMFLTNSRSIRDIILFPVMKPLD